MKKKIATLLLATFFAASQIQANEPLLVQHAINRIDKSCGPKCNGLFNKAMLEQFASEDQTRGLGTHGAGILGLFDVIAYHFKNKKKAAPNAFDESKANDCWHCAIEEGGLGWADLGGYHLVWSRKDAPSKQLADAESLRYLSTVNERPWYLLQKKLGVGQLVKICSAFPGVTAYRHQPSAYGYMMYRLQCSRRDPMCAGKDANTVTPLDYCKYLCKTHSSEEQSCYTYCDQHFK